MKSHRRRRRAKQAALAAKMLHTQKGRLYRLVHGSEPVQLTSILKEGRLITERDAFLATLADTYAATMQPLHASC
jgi:hypothetical protein